VVMIEKFIRELAQYFVENQAQKSIELGMGKPSAQQWQRLRSLTPLFGYPTTEEAELVLTSFLRGDLEAETRAEKAEAENERLREKIREDYGPNGDGYPDTTDVPERENP